jgi:hypothetical protein
MAGLVELLWTLKDKDEVIFCAPVLFSTFYRTLSMCYKSHQGQESSRGKNAFTVIFQLSEGGIL